MNKDFLRDKPKYIDRLEKIIEFEKRLEENETSILEDTKHKKCWTNTDAPVRPQLLYQLEVNGFLERVFDSNRNTMYTLSKTAEYMDDFLEDFQPNAADVDGAVEEIHDFPDSEDLDDDLFDDVIGYDDVKWLLKRALTTDDIVNVLLVGPPGSAKTVFLLCIENLEGSVFVSGKPTSGPGVLDTMFEQTPKYLAIDEFDDTDKDVQQVLSQHMDTGIIDETKVGKNRTMRTNTNTFGSANSTKDIIEQVKDRFVVLEFEKYDKNEFMEICEHLLVRREGCDKDEARKIGEEVWKMEGDGNVRKAISIARLSRGDPEEVVDIIGRYKKSDSFSGLVN